MKERLQQELARANMATVVESLVISLGDFASDLAVGFELMEENAR